MFSIIPYLIIAAADLLSAVMIFIALRSLKTRNAPIKILFLPVKLSLLGVLLGIILFFVPIGGLSLIGIYVFFLFLFASIITGAAGWVYYFLKR